MAEETDQLNEDGIDKQEHVQTSLEDTTIENTNNTETNEEKADNISKNQVESIQHTETKEQKKHDINTNTAEMDNKCEKKENKSTQLTETKEQQKHDITNTKTDNTNNKYEQKETKIENDKVNVVLKQNNKSIHIIVKLLLVIVPILLSLYLHFSDTFISNTVSWREIIENDNILPVEFEVKCWDVFDVWNPKTGETLKLDINTVSKSTLNDLLMDWGVDPYGIGDKKIGTDLLLKVSSSDFWRLNYFLHPKKSRIRNWLWTHKMYLSQIAKLEEFNDRRKLRKHFNTVFRKDKESYELVFFTDHEDKMMFQFFRDHLKFLDIDILQKEHEPLLEKVKFISKQLKDKEVHVNDVKKSIKEWEGLIVKHFTEEEELIVPVMLNLDNALYRTYRSYLSWFYYLMY